MIKADNVTTLLLEACPSATRKWQDHLSYWEDDERGHHTDISVFAHHIVDSFSEQKTEEFPKFFTLLEKLIEEGDEETRGLAIVGLIEDIQNIASHRSHGYNVFYRWLGPLSEQGWMEIEQLWSGKSSLADVIRSQKNASN